MQPSPALYVPILLMLVLGAATLMSEPVLAQGCAPACTCGSGHDQDGDLCKAHCDNCPTTYNPSQDDNDCDGIGDACDPDDDNDGILDDDDNCPTVYNPSQADSEPVPDGIGDACDPDDDNDGILDDDDNCPTTYNPSQADSEPVPDGIGDACDPDDDNDGVLDDGDGSGTIGDSGCDPDPEGQFSGCDDNCRVVVNPTQANVDHDLLGDHCDDSDGDGLLDVSDNCVFIFNPAQQDYDLDGEGDHCDAWTICAPQEPMFPPIHLPIGYEGLVPPARGESQPDPQSGCTITRLSDAFAEYGTVSGISTYAHNEYSTMSPFNSNSSLVRLLVPRIPGDPLNSEHGFSVVDLAGKTIRTREEIYDPLGINDPRWSVMDPAIFYYLTTEADSNGDYHLMEYDVRGCDRTSLHSFDAPAGVGGFPSTSDEGLSEDGDHLLLSHGIDEFNVYQFSTDSLTPVTGYPMGSPDVAFLECLMTPNVNVLCEIHPVPPIDPNDSPAFTSGMYLYTHDPAAGTFTNPVFVTALSGHGSVGRDPTDLDSNGLGEEVWISFNTEIRLDKDLEGGCWSGLEVGKCLEGIVKVRLRDGKRTCLLTLRDVFPDIPGPQGWPHKSVHVSINNIDGHPWALVSTSDWEHDPSLDTRNFDLPAAWQDLWGLYYNELILVDMAGCRNHRLAHHRSRDGNTLDPSDSGYWSLPRAAISRDGNYVAFDSNYGIETQFPSYTDVYMVTTRYAAPPPPPQPDCPLCYIEFCPEIGVRCTANGSCEYGECGQDGCCNYDCTCDGTCTTVQSPPSACSLDIPAGCPPPCPEPCQVSSYCQQEGIKCTHTGQCEASGCCIYECGPDLSCQGSDPVPGNACGGGQF